MSDKSKLDVDSVTEPLRPCVRFSPPLSDQRQIFLLDILREHNPDSVLDIGCGEGSVLEAVCRPCFALPVSPTFDQQHGIQADAPTKCVEDTCGSLNFSKVAGLDISKDVLGRASRAIEAIDDASNYGAWTKPRPRWSALEVKLWMGGLQSFNPGFRDYEVILSSEVIEHLPADVLDCFCPMILGRYAPKILAITTPGFEFNCLFTPPDAMLSNDPSTPVVREGGYLDPTGRTRRVFRHSDHKFEWTRSEFRDWCTSNASYWGYRVTISGVGRSTVPDPWGRDEPDRFGREGELPLLASQTAVFTRISEDAEKHRQQYETDAIALLQKAVYGLQDDNHHLFAHQILSAHPSLSPGHFQPSNETILEATKASIIESCSSSALGEIEIWDLWNMDTISLACQGALGRLYEALEAGVSGLGFHGSTPDNITGASNKMGHEWEWIEPEKRTRWTRKIRWNHYKPTEDGDNLWSSNDTLPSETWSNWGQSTPDLLRDSHSGIEKKDQVHTEQGLNVQWEADGWGPSPGNREGSREEKKAQEDWGVSFGS